MAHRAEATETQNKTSNTIKITQKLVVWKLGDKKDNDLIIKNESNT